MVKQKSKQRLWRNVGGRCEQCCATGRRHMRLWGTEGVWAASWGLPSGSCSVEVGNRRTRTRTRTDAFLLMLKGAVTAPAAYILTAPTRFHTCPPPVPQGATDKALTDAAREAVASSFPAASTPGPTPLACEARVLRWGSTSDRRAGGGFAAGFSHLGPLASPDDLLACAAPVKDRLCFAGTD